VHISQEQLGVFVGAARESVNRQLQLWRRDGILGLPRGRNLRHGKATSNSLTLTRASRFSAKSCPSQRFYLNPLRPRRV